MPSGDEQQQLPPQEQLSVAVITLSRIFERILTDVYMKQVVSIHVAETISNQHRAWVRSLPVFLRMQTERLDSKTLDGTLAAAHVFGSYYWSIILLTRPFLIYRVSQYVKNKTGPSERTNNSRIALFADACVYSALRGLDIVDDLTKFTPLPRRLPFLINSVFNSAIVLGAAFFADYDNLLPLEEGMNKAEKFLELFIPHDPHACRFFQIIRYLHGAVVEYVQRRNRRWMDRRSKQVDQLFGQVGPGPSNDANAADLTPSQSQANSNANNESAVPSPISPDKFSRPSFPSSQQQHHHHHPPNPHHNNTNTDIWDTLYGNETSSTLSYDPADIAALTTTGIPIGCSPGGSIPPPPSAPAAGSQIATGSGLTPTAVPGTGTRASAGGGNTPISDVIFPDNGLFYMAEDLPVFGIWGDT